MWALESVLNKGRWPGFENSGWGRLQSLVSQKTRMPGDCSKRNDPTLYKLVLIPRILKEERLRGLGVFLELG